jgi:hypothetical protein
MLAFLIPRFFLNICAGEFWLVINGTRRGFDSYPTFLQLGMYNELGINLYSKEVEQIPVGPTITAAEAAAAAAAPSTGAAANSLIRFYLPLGNSAGSSASGGPVSNPNPNPGADPMLGEFNISAISREIIAERIARREQMRRQRTGASDNAAAAAPAGKGCEVNGTLEELVHANGTRCILYLVAHDSDSEHLARKFSQCKESWIQPVRIASSVFFESIIYRELFPPYMTEWENLDFVVSGTYKTVGKQLHYNKFNQNLELIQASLQIARDGNYDIVPFLRSGSGTMSFCAYFHGKQFKVTGLAYNQNFFSTFLIPLPPRSQRRSPGTPSCWSWAIPCTSSGPTMR